MSCKSPTTQPTNATKILPYNRKPTLGFANYLCLEARGGVEGKQQAPSSRALMAVYAHIYTIRCACMEIVQRSNGVYVHMPLMLCSSVLITFPDRACTSDSIYMGIYCH
jgi:hypothetical protein